MLGRRLGFLAPLLGLAFVWGLFALLAGADFAKWDNQRLMLLQTVVVGTAAIGATWIILAGGIDLSVGSTIALGTVLVAKLLSAGVAPVWAALLTVVCAALCGLWLAAWVVGATGRAVGAALGAGIVVLLWTPLGPFGALAVGALVLFAAGAGLARIVPQLPLAPFIVTLGAWGALRGAAKGLADNQPVYPPRTDTWLHGLMQRGDGLLAPGVWVLLALALLAAMLLNTSRFGRHVVAIGSNEETARLCGVHVARTKLCVYALGIGCAGLAALFQFAYLSMGDPTTANGCELKVIAAVVIGGASLSGGEGSIRGTLIGALIMTVVDNGCTKLGLDNWVQEMVTGGMIVAAVLLDRWRSRR